MFRRIWTRLLAPFSAFFEAHAAAHYRLERHSMGLALAIIAAAMVGGFIEIAPLFTIDDTVEAAPNMRVYTPLEQAGRDIYIREGCYLCHSQMIRTLATRSSATGRIRWRLNRSTTIRCSGGRSARVRTLRGSARNTPTTGRSGTW